MDDFEALKAYKNFAQESPEFSLPESLLDRFIIKAGKIGALILKKSQSQVPEVPLTPVTDINEWRKRRTEKRSDQ
jgi:hypothetical protein